MIRGDDTNLATLSERLADLILSMHSYEGTFDVEMLFLSEVEATAKVLIDRGCSVRTSNNTLHVVVPEHLRPAGLDSVMADPEFKSTNS